MYNSPGRYVQSARRAGKNGRGEVGGSAGSAVLHRVDVGGDLVFAPSNQTPCINLATLILCQQPAV